MASTIDEHSKLLEEINRLQQDKRNLTVRVQGIEVLAKVLQDAQDENSKLKQEVIELKGELEGTSVNISPSLQTTPSMAAQGRCFLSQQEDDSSISESSFEYVKCLPRLATPISGNFPCSYLHMEELRSGFRTMKNESDTLLEQAKNMLELIGSAHVSDEGADLASKVSSLMQRIGKHAKDVKARETYLKGLATEEEKLKGKLIDLESEQDSQKKVMENLKVQLKDDKEELQGIGEQIQFLCEAVVVNKEDARSIENYSSIETSSSSSQVSNSLSKLNTRDKELGEPGTPPACGQCLELMQQLQQVKREKEVAIRQKEEILDVNHAWDVQYKKLKAETGKEIADLKHQIDMIQNSDMWKSATATIEQERQAKHKALEEKNKLEEKCRELEEQLGRLPLQDKYQLQQTPSASSRMSFVSSPTNNKQPSISSHSALTEDPPQDTIKEIEVLKQQLRVYADDFACERQDRERMQGEKEQLETEVRDLKEQVAVLKEQVSLYEEDFKKESQEKDRLRRQLNFQREGPDPEIRLSNMTRKAQAVAERQARLQALREQCSREERHLLQDQQELRQTARVMAIQSESPNTLHDIYAPRPWTYSQDIHPRGPSEPQRSSNDMFHGGDVQADNRHLGHGREVIDHASKDHCCPRCFRLFPRDDEKSYKKHTMKCIE